MMNRSMASLDEYDGGVEAADAAGKKLVDRLLNILGDGIAQEEPQHASELSSASGIVLDETGGPPEEPHDDPRRKGISLPAAAMDWLVRFFDDDDDDDDDDGGDEEDRRSLLMSLLHHVKSLRVTLEPWPAATHGTVVDNARHNGMDPHVAIRRFVATIKRRPVIDLRYFTKLQVLWLDQIPVEWIIHNNDSGSGSRSTKNNTGWSQTLQVLRITHACIYNLRESPLLKNRPSSSQHHHQIDDDDGAANETTNIDAAVRPLHEENYHDHQESLYPSLTHLQLSHCGLHDGSGLMRPRRRRQQPDQRQLPLPVATLALLGRHLRSVDLSHNELSTEAAALASLRHLRDLQKLDVSYNRLSTVATIGLRVYSTLRILNLAHNQLLDVTGLETLSSLVTLRLDHNRLTQLQDTANRLAGLTQLQQLALEGNPLQFVDDGVMVGGYMMTKRRKRKMNESYRLDVLNAFRERRFSMLTATDFSRLTLRSVQALLPVLDDRPASLTELRNLRGRTFVPIRLVPLAVQLAAHQTTTSLSPSRRRRRRVVTAPIVEGDVMTGWRRPPDAVLPTASDRRGNGSSASPGTVRFSSQDVVQYLSANLTLPNNARAKPMSDQTISQVPENLMVETSFRSEREEWEAAFADNIGIRYINSARLPTIVVANENTSNKDGVDRNASSTRSVVKMKTFAGSETTLMVDAKPSLSHDEVDATADLVDLSLSAIKDDEDDMKASGTTTVTTAASTQPGQAAQPVPRSLTPERMVPPSLLKTGMDQRSFSSSTPQGNRLPLQVTPFSDHHWQDDNSSVPSSLGTPYKSDGGLTKWELLRLAEENSKFEGPYMYQKLLVHSQMELYFEQFVFAEPKKVSSEIWYDTLCQYPKIALWPVDRKRRDEASQSSQHFSLNADDREALRRAWKETIVPCGKHALRRLTPKRSERYGFHGELLWTSTNGESMRPDIAIDARQTVCCNSDKFFYIMIDHDTATSTPKNGDSKQFPRPVPKKAVFRNACWPHALACHSFDTLERITIGFSFQRLTLQFRHASSNEVFVYVLLTASKVATVDLLKEFQELAGNAKGSGFGVTSAPAMEIDNDDPVVLDAIGSAIAPDSLGVVLHYQIVRQRWKHGDRGLVRRVCILTDTNIYLMDEDYGGDGSTSNVATRLGHSFNRLVDGASLNHVVEVQAARDDPAAITIVLRLASLSKPHNWRLVCRTKEGAEKLVDDVRKATRGLKR